MIKIRSVKTAVAVFFLALGWASISHAGPLIPDGNPKYFHSDLLASTSLSHKSQELCEDHCDHENLRLAKKRRRAPSARKISNSADQDPGPKLNSDYFKGILTDTRYILLSPLRWDTSDWLKATLVLGATGAFFAFDDEIQEFAEDERSSTTNTLADIFVPFGNGGYSFPGLVAFYIYGHFAKNEKAKRAALLSVESFAITGLFTFALKFSTGRARPSSAEDSSEWNGFNFDDVSFPSGHTSSAFAIATVLASEYEDTPLVPPIAYGLAFLTGLSRINDNKHWASDVFLGGALGYFVSKTILKLHSSKKGRHYTIYPRISSKETGVVLAYRF